MKISNENDFRAEIEAALVMSMESIRDAVNVGAWTRGDLLHERLWIMAARAYADASDHIEARGLTAMSKPLWLVQADADDPLAVSEIEKWIEENKREEDEAFVFPDMPLSGDFGYTVLFLTESKETASLFRTFYS